MFRSDQALDRFAALLAEPEDRLPRAAGHIRRRPAVPSPGTARAAPLTSGCSLIAADARKPTCTSSTTGFRRAHISS